MDAALNEYHDHDLDWRLWKAAIAREANAGFSQSEVRRLIEAAAAELGEPLGRGRYTEWARECGALTAEGVEVSLGHRWAIVCMSLGIDPGRSNKNDRSDRTSRATCLAAVRRCAEFIGWIPTYTEYERWARTVPDVPCGAIVRRRCSGWAGVIAALRAEERA